MKRFPFQPVIILGAPRSGTNILRDVLTHTDGLETWPCDEINAIWRHGNQTWPNDQFPAQLATSVVKKFIRGRFHRQWQRSGQPKFIVEKTCANMLRVPFVDAVLPEAKFIHILRNETDVVKSAKRRWQGEFEGQALPYLLAKLRYVPVSDLPYIGWRFITRAIGKRDHYQNWGPVPSDMPDTTDVAEKCQAQWRSCVLAASTALQSIDECRHCTIRYEALVRDPYLVVKQIFDFLDHPVSEREIYQAVKLIRRSDTVAMPDLLDLQEAA